MSKFLPVQLWTQQDGTNCFLCNTMFQTKNFFMLRNYMHTSLQRVTAQLSENRMANDGPRIFSNNFDTMVCGEDLVQHGNIWHDWLHQRFLSKAKHGMETDVFRVSLVSMATVQPSRDLRCYVLWKSDQWNKQKIAGHISFIFRKNDVAILAACRQQQKPENDIWLNLWMLMGVYCIFLFVVKKIVVVFVRNMFLFVSRCFLFPVELWRIMAQDMVATHRRCGHAGNVNGHRSLCRNGPATAGSTTQWPEWREGISWKTRSL